MYMSEISKSKVPDLKAQKIIILWTLKHVSALSEQPVLCQLVSQTLRVQSVRFVSSQSVFIKKIPRE